MNGMVWRSSVPAACLAACLAGGPILHAQQVGSGKETRSVSVTAIGRASAKADAATVHIGYVIYGPDATTAYARGSKPSNEVTAALAKGGVPKDAVESESQALAEAQPFESNDLPGEQRADRRYKLQQSWTVKTSAADAKRVLDEAVKAGANASGQIEWRMNDQDALHGKAVQDAMVRARKNAELLATGMGVKLGILLQASDNSPIQQFAALDQISKAVAGAAINGRLDQVQPLSVNPRKIEESAVLSAVFAIE
jgi:uncharacterized protein YggE